MAVSELDIRSGGVVEVDTGSLRAVAVELENLAGEAADIRVDLQSALARLQLVGREAFGAVWTVTALEASVMRAGDDAAHLAARVRLAADQYEAVDLLVQRGLAEARGDAAGVRRLDRLLDGLPTAARDAAERSLDAGADLDALARQALWVALLLGSPASLLAPSVVRGLGGSLSALGRGRIHAGDRLSGPRVPVAVRRLTTSAVSAPTGLADAAGRMPGAGDTRIRVERYAMPSGRAQFAVYIAGTQSIGGDDAFDVASNVELYGGSYSASYDATLAALDEAGARPGDVVHAFGHSQGGMIAEWMAVDGRYDVQTVATFGAPVQADVPESTLAVGVRHSDDPVVALQAGGHAAGVGAPSSFVVERVADPLPRALDLVLPAHQMDSYTETAAMIDASTDPRVDSLRAVFADLARADSVEATEYAARRVSPSSSGAG